MTGYFLVVLTFLGLACGTLRAQTISDNTELLGTLAPRGTGANAYASIWGYAANGREYALLGGYLGTSIIDITDPSSPREVAFIAGPHNIWREIKTYRHYAYVVHDANDNGDPGQGVQIIDLSQLPDTAVLVNTYVPDNDPGLVHTLYIDNGFAYLYGTRSAQGAIILDLRQDPVYPVEAGRWNGIYWHDAYVRNDTIYAAAMFDGSIQIVDVRDKANPTEISRTRYPGAFTHNVWLSDGSRYMSSTDEIADRPLNFWDASDPVFPELAASYTPGPRSIVHNTHHHNGLTFLSCYFDGLKILDLANEQAPVEVAHYDTFADDNFQRDEGFDGAWGVYPYLPSGNVIVSDMRYGLFVVRFNGTRAGFVEGTIRNAVTAEPVSDVAIHIDNLPASEGVTTVRVGTDGRYTFGSKPGMRRITFSKYGYEPYSLDVDFQSGQTLVRDIPLQPLPRTTLIVRVLSPDNQPVPGVVVALRGPYGFSTELTSDANGSAALPAYFGNYELELVQWGYLYRKSTVSVEEPSVYTIDLIAERGYVESFTRPVDWRYSDTTNNSGWAVIPAVTHTFGNNLPDAGPDGDPLNRVAVSRARFGSATLISPPFDATVLSTALLRFDRFFHPASSKSSESNDSLRVDVSNDNGLTWTTVDVYTAVDEQWTARSYRLDDYLPLTTAMRVRFVHSEGVNAPIRLSSYAMVDNISMVSSTLTLVPEQPATPHIAVSPHPVADVLTVRWQTPTDNRVTLSAMDIHGRTVLPARRVDAGTSSVVLPTAELAPGMYLLRIDGGAGISTLPFMVLR